MLPDHLTRLHDEMEPRNMHGRPRRPMSRLGSGFALNLRSRQVGLPGAPACPQHTVIPFSDTSPPSPPSPKREHEGAISREEWGCQLGEGMQKVPGKAAGSWGLWGWRGSAAPASKHPILQTSTIPSKCNSCKQIASVAMCSAGTILAGRTAGRGT